MRTANSLEKSPMLGKTEGRRRRGRQRMGWLDGITDLMDSSLLELRVGDGQGGLACCNSWARKESDMTEWQNWTELSATWESHRVQNWPQFQESPADLGTHPFHIRRSTAYSQCPSHCAHFHLYHTKSGLYNIYKCYMFINPYYNGFVIIIVFSLVYCLLSLQGNILQHD